tara:strand:- start:154 stop:999 length:846 start_codon:yes stop_codon:yes gene_type:complete
MSLSDLTNQQDTMKGVIKDAKKEMKKKIKKLKKKKEDSMMEDAILKCYDNSGVVNDDGDCDRNKELACVMKGKTIHKGKCVNIDKLKNNFIDKQVCNKPYLHVRDGKCVLKPKHEFAVNCHFKKSGLRQKKVVINNECKRRRYLKKELDLCGSGLKYDYRTKSCVPDFKVYCKGATTYDRKNKQCVFKEITFDQKGRDMCEKGKKGKFIYNDETNTCEPACQMRLFGLCVNPMEKPKIPSIGTMISNTTTSAVGGVSSVLNMGKNAVLGGVSKIPIPKVKF